MKLGKYYSKDNKDYDKTFFVSKLRGEFKSDGSLHIFSTETVFEERLTKLKENGKEFGGIPLANITDTWQRCNLGIGGDLSIYQTHFILQLPINQSQSSQTFIPDPIQEQPIALPKTNLSVNISAGQAEETPQEEDSNPCTQPNLDDAMKEYCQNKAYNKKLGEEEKAQDLAQEKAIKQEEKKKQAHQKKLDAWYEEERQANIKHIEGLSKQKKRSQEAEEKENQAFHESIAKDQAERKAKQAEIKKAHDIVDRFGNDYASQRLSHKKIEELSKNADLDKSQKIKNAMRKQYYDSSQTKLQGEAEYQTAKADEIGKKGDYVKSIKDTSLTVNKIAAKFDPTGTGDKIVGWQEDAYSAIEGHEKGGWSGAIDNLVDKKASDASSGWSDTLKEEIETYKKYQKEGIKLKKNEFYYDIKGNRHTKVKKGQKLYDKDHNEITFSFKKRIFSNTVKKLNDDYNAINTAETKVEEFKEGVVTGDFNKAVNAGLDAMDAKDSIDGGTDKAVKKLEGKTASD